MKKPLLLFSLICGSFFLVALANAAPFDRLRGYILLQVEDRGEAWYVNPANNQRYYLKNGSAAYNLMRSTGLGISNANLKKIPVGIEVRFQETDADGDGLADKLEESLGADPSDQDSDHDGYSDGVEVRSGYNPLGPDHMVSDVRLVNQVRGRILLQVESKGEAWYVNPQNGKRYYLKDGEAAYQIMRYLSLGITNRDLAQIFVAPTSGLPTDANNDTPAAADRTVVVTALTGTEQVFPTGGLAFTLSPNGRWLGYQDQGEHTHLYDTVTYQDAVFTLGDPDHPSSFLVDCWLPSGDYCIIPTNVAYLSVVNNTPQELDLNTFLTARAGYVFGDQEEIVHEVQPPDYDNDIEGIYTDSTGFTGSMIPNFRDEILTCADCANNDDTSHDKPASHTMYRFEGEGTDQLKLYAVDSSTGSEHIIKTFTADFSQDIARLREEFADDGEEINDLLDDLAHAPTCLHSDYYRLSPDQRHLAFILTKYLGSCSWGGGQELVWVDLKSEDVYTVAQEDIFEPRWSPDSSRLYFGEKIDAAGPTFQLFFAKLQ